jgi:hypothetical protein
MKARSVDEGGEYDCRYRAQQVARGLRSISPQGILFKADEGGVMNDFLSYDDDIILYKRT